MKRKPFEHVELPKGLYDDPDELVEDDEAEEEDLSDFRGNKEENS